ncbi:unnamed protein product [Adineta ricciae]|uniref:G-protein coupled receptors family 1 profile domain-containing protein n=1 Tax=Adineta ricciae TaxID=249248 RepID=A0A815KCC4_ADIRI|nr:unnamed protein product [Adineta ricciae]CAF1394153.1 unnamed protein product [Adineta ricciae]
MYSNMTNSQQIATDGRNMTDSGCDFDILVLIMEIQSILLVIFGFVANLFSFVVLIQPRLRRRPTFSYLAFLSLSNALLSLVHAFFTIIGLYFGLTLENLSLFIFCRLLNRFLIDFLTHFSLYTLTAVDIDRVRTVTSKTNQQPNYNSGHRSLQYGCAKAFLRVCIIELSFVCVFFLVNLHWLTSYGYTASRNYQGDIIHVTMCTVVDTDGYSLSYGIYLTTILPIVELIMFGIVPFLISLFATIIILRQVSVKESIMNSANKHLQQSRRRKELHLSILLISLNCVFLLFTTPHLVYTIHVGDLRNRLNSFATSEGEICSVAFTQKSLDLLQQCYFMSTFFLYILTNKRFREEFYRLFRCCIFSCRRSHNPPKSQAERIHRPKINENFNRIDGKKQNNLSTPFQDRFGSRASLSDASQDDELATPLDN